MAPNVYFLFLQYENFAAIIYWHRNLYLVSACVLFKNNVLQSDTVPLHNKVNCYVMQA